MGLKACVDLGAESELDELDSDLFLFGAEFTSGGRGAITGKVHSNIGGRGDPSANCEFKANSFK